MHHAHRRRTTRIALTAIASAAALTLGAAAPAGAVQFAGNFQMRAAFNDPANETTVTGGWEVHHRIDSRSGDGVGVAVTVGEPYTLTISGTYSFWRDAPEPWLADAECSIESTGAYSPDPTTWVPHRWLAMYGDDYLDVKVSEQRADGSFAVRELDWAPVDPHTDPATGAPGCSATHTYTADFVPTASAIGVFVDDRYGHGDNAGALELTVTGPAPTFEQLYPCPKWTEQMTGWGSQGTLGVLDHATMTLDSRRDPWHVPDPTAVDADGEPVIEAWQETGHFGMYTCNFVVPDAAYLIQVDGTYQWGEDPGLVADAECATTPDDPVFRADRFVSDDGVPRDWLDVYVDLERVDWVPMGRIDPDDPRCSLDHQYCIVFTPDFAGPLNLKIYDLVYAELDNVGTLDIEITRLG